MGSVPVRPIRERVQPRHRSGAGARRRAPGRRRRDDRAHGTRVAILGRLSGIGSHDARLSDDPGRPPRRRCRADVETAPRTRRGVFEPRGTRGARPLPRGLGARASRASARSSSPSRPAADPASAVAFVLGLAAAGLGLAAGAGSQALQRRADGAVYAGPSPVLVFVAAFLLTLVVGFAVGALDVLPEGPVAVLASVLISAAVSLGLVALVVVGSGALGWREMGLRLPGPGEGSPLADVALGDRPRGPHPLRGGAPGGHPRRAPGCRADRPAPARTGSGRRPRQPARRGGPGPALGGALLPRLRHDGLGRDRRAAGGDRPGRRLLRPDPRHHARRQRLRHARSGPRSSPSRSGSRSGWSWAGSSCAGGPSSPRSRSTRRTTRSRCSWSPSGRARRRAEASAAARPCAGVRGAPLGAGARAGERRVSGG